MQLAEESGFLIEALKRAYAGACKAEERALADKILQPNALGASS